MVMRKVSEALNGNSFKWVAIVAMAIMGWGLVELVDLKANAVSRDELNEARVCSDAKIEAIIEMHNHDVELIYKRIEAMIAVRNHNIELLYGKLENTNNRLIEEIGKLKDLIYELNSKKENQ